MIEVFIPLVLSVCGMIMIVSLSFRNNILNPYAQPLKQFQFIGIGITLMLCCMKIHPDTFRKSSGRLWGVSFLLLVLTLIIGVRVGGARRWLGLLGFRFQPLELLLFAVPIFMADRLTDKQSSIGRRSDLHSFLRPTMMVILMSGLPLMLQPNLGGTIIVAAICFVMHIERKGWKYPALGVVIAFLAVVILILIAPYRMRRVRAFIDPWDDPTDTGFQIIQGLVAFANGSVTGVGIGRGLQQERYLPEAETDYIFPAIGEEFGLIGTMFLLSLYAVWTWRAYYIYRDAKTPFLKSLTLGLTASVIFPMFINVMGVTKLMPLTGIPMPFISAGGSSMIFMWMKVGLLLSIKSLNKTKRKHKAKIINKPAQPEIILKTGDSEIKQTQDQNITADAENNNSIEKTALEKIKSDDKHEHTSKSK